MKDIRVSKDTGTSKTIDCGGLRQRGQENVEPKAEQMVGGCRELHNEKCIIKLLVKY